ncbi:MAG: hypothetical protein ACK4NC_04295 [Candidatus Gracilibacteria bacterium]
MDELLPMSIKEYYEHFDLSSWNESLDLYSEKLQTCSEKDRKIWTVRLYTTHLQLVEVFWINIFTITENDLWNNLFLSNNQLRKRLNLVLERKNYYKFTKYFFNNWVFGVNDKSLIENFDRKKSLYFSILSEISHDYLKDFELLNAFKHGFRMVSSQGGVINLQSDKGESFQLNNFNSSFSYYSKDFKKNLIIQNYIYFNWERIMQKSVFLLNMLENTIQVLTCKSDEKISLFTLIDTNKEEFIKFFGTFRLQTKYKLNE